MFCPETDYKVIVSIRTKPTEESRKKNTQRGAANKKKKSTRGKLSCLKQIQREQVGGCFKVLK